jgi:hypothetical protein
MALREPVTVRLRYPSTGTDSTDLATITGRSLTLREGGVQSKEAFRTQVSSFNVCVSEDTCMTKGAQAALTCKPAHAIRCALNGIPFNAKTCHLRIKSYGCNEWAQHTDDTQSSSRAVPAALSTFALHAVRCSGAAARAAAAG